MSTPLARQAGAALTWKGIQLLASRAISLARYLVLARLLTPDDFGLFAIAIVPLQLMLSVTDFGMVPALVQSGESDERVYDIAWTVGLARAAIIVVCLWIAAPLIAQLFAEPRAIPVLRALALRPLIGATTSIKVAQFERRLKFGPLTWMDVAAASVSAVAAIALAPSLGIWALVIGTLAGTASGVAMSYRIAPHRPRLVFDVAPARSLFRFGRWVFLTGLVGVAGDAVLRAVISRRLGAADLGLYYLAFNLAVLPADIVTGLVVAVAFPVHARVRSDLRRTAEAFRASIAGMAAVLCPTYAMLIALAPSLVDHVLGPRWAGTAPILRLLALATVLGISYDATAPMLEGRGEPHMVTALHAIVSATVAALSWLLTGAYGLEGAALAWVLAQGAMLVACVVFSKRILAGSLAGLPRSLGAIAVVSVIAGGTALMLDSALSGVAGLGAGVVLAVCIMTALLWMLDSRLDLGLGRDFARAFPEVASRVRRSPRGG